jgi:hypothetical protein
MSIGKARRDLIESKVLDADSIWRRLWYAHLSWGVWGSCFQLRSTAAFVWHSFLIRYCRTSDRIFGGMRYARYQKGQRLAAERSKRKIAELQKQRKERRWRHEQFISAVDQRMNEIEQDLRALARGKAVVRDPATYN